MSQQIKSTANFIKGKINCDLHWAVILGSGLGDFVDEVECIEEIAYSELPYFPESTVDGHEGKLIIGRINRKNLLIFQGRFHFYEGYSMSEVVAPVQLAHELDIKKLVVSNASGGVNKNFKVGDIMLISDHISLLLPTNPLIGPNDPAGPRFPDMSCAYSKPLRKAAISASKALDIELKEGVYVGVTGPTFETPAEYRMVRLIGGDAVGMSTVPEVMKARHLGIDVLGLSVITDLGIEGHVEVISHEDVQKAAHENGKKMTAIVKAVINEH